MSRHIILQSWEKVLFVRDRLPRNLRKALEATAAIERVGLPCSGVRLRTAASKQFDSQINASWLIGKTLTIAELSFRKLKAPQPVDQVARGARCNNGAEASDAA